MNGRFIVLEGPDGAGTTSHTKALAEHLRNRGLDVLQTFEATDGPIGTFIREKLRSGGMAGNAIQLLFTADRAWHEREVILPALERGQIVVCDRYSLSTVLYGTAQGEDRHWLEAMNRVFVQPDLQLLALPPLETCMERLGIREKDSFESDDSLQTRVYRLYEGEALVMPRIDVFDTSKDFAETASRIAARADAFLAA